MTTPDPHYYDDAAYVLGALSADERSAFEQHLLICPDCAARVREIADVPSWLAQASAADLPVLDPDAVGDPPSTLLASLRAAAARRRRRYAVAVGALATVAAACAIALVVVLVPGTSHQPAARAFTAVGGGAVPVVATARLTAEQWGTAIEVHCAYEGYSGGPTVQYGLVVIDRKQRRQTIGGWGAISGRPFDGTMPTSWRPDQISELQITVNRKPILLLRV